jgi:hypothetical protein
MPLPIGVDPMFRAVIFDRFDLGLADAPGGASRSPSGRFMWIMRFMRIMVLSGRIERDDHSGLWTLKHFLSPRMRHLIDLSALRIVGFDPSRAHAVNQYVTHFGHLACDPRRQLEFLNPPHPIAARLRELHASWRIDPPIVWRRRGRLDPPWDPMDDPMP